VEACAADGSGCSWFGTTNVDGDYSATGLLGGDYVIRAFPPAGSTLIPASIGVTIATAEHVTGADIQLGGPVPPPPGTGIIPSRPGGGGVPVVYWRDQTILTTTGCPNGSATYAIILEGDVTRASGPMTESPAGSGNYTATVPALHPSVGNAVVRIHIVCPGGPPVDVSFPLYIDPSGVVRTVSGMPVAGATVTLFRSDSGNPGSFDQVPDGSVLMSPSNRSNPDTTDALGQFGWDVVTGFYVVRAEKAGCRSPDGTQPFVDSPVLTIPPAVLDLDLRLDCPPPTTSDLAVVRITAPATVLQGSAPRPVSVQIQNRGVHAESITLANLGDGVTTGLVRLAVAAVDNDGESCEPAVVTLGANAPLFRRGALVLRPRAILTVRFLVTYQCSDAARRDAKDLTAADYQHTATVFASALGSVDPHPADDVCPHHPAGKIGGVVDRGCGVRQRNGTYAAPPTNVIGR
jgi:hypothetical protein